MKGLEKYMSKGAADARKDYTNPIDWFNKYGDIERILREKAKVGADQKERRFSDKDETLLIDVRSINSKQPAPLKVEHIPVLLDDKIGTWTRLDNGYFLMNCSVADISLTPGNIYSPFELLTVYVYNNDWMGAFKYVESDLLKKEVPFIRVGCDYYRKVVKKNAFGVQTVQLKQWRKETIKDDYGAAYLTKQVPQFSDFTIEPNNIDFKIAHRDLYNLYAPFPHKPSKKTATRHQFEHIDLLLNHIFETQTEMAYKYFKILYEHPRQILPVMVLTSRERQTGKTTFLNLLAIIFGDNHVQISPDDLTNDFNSSYANKNIIVVDETSIEKQAAVERIKSISTAKTITVNQKHVAHYSIPFYGKIVLATNREKDFMRIDEEEIRFWVLKVRPIEQKITDIEIKMRDEVPYFLRYLLDLPAVDFSRDRMVFTADELKNEQLEAVVEESRSGLYKEISEHARAFFENEFVSSEFYATAKDIKNRWFPNDSRIGLAYIRKVCVEELKLDYDCENGKTTRYYAFGGGDSMVGRPFVFKLSKFFPEGVSRQEAFDPNLKIDDDDAIF
jgi:hypothetical protein